MITGLWSIDGQAEPGLSVSGPFSPLTEFSERLAKTAVVQAGRLPVHLLAIMPDTDDTAQFNAPASVSILSGCDALWGHIANAFLLDTPLDSSRFDIRECWKIFYPRIPFPAGVATDNTTVHDQVEIETSPLRKALVDDRPLPEPAKVKPTRSDKPSPFYCENDMTGEVEAGGPVIRSALAGTDELAVIANGQSIPPLAVNQLERFEKILLKCVNSAIGDKPIYYCTVQVGTQDLTSSGYLLPALIVVASLKWGSIISTKGNGTAFKVFLTSDETGSCPLGYEVAGIQISTVAACLVPCISALKECDMGEYINLDPMVAHFGRWLLRHRYDASALDFIFDDVDG